MSIFGSFKADFMDDKIIANIMTTVREITVAIIKAAMSSTEEHLQSAQVFSGFCLSWHLCLVHQLIVGSYRVPFDTITSI